MSIKFSITGDGPVKLVLLHGWLSDSSIFDPILPFFDKNKYTLLKIDFRGYGESATVSGNYSIEETANDALSVVDTLKWDKFHVIGHSMGGMVMQKMALLSPKQILSGIAITPVPSSGFYLDTEQKDFFESSSINDSALSEIFNILTGRKYAMSFILWLTQNARNVTTKEAFLGYLKMWTQTDFSTEVNAIGIPIYVIAGKHDGALGEEHMKETYLKQLANVHMDVIAEAGHYPLYETSPELFTKIEKFIVSQST